MPQILIFILGAVVGGVAAWFLRRDRVVERKRELAVNVRRIEEKEKAKTRIMELLAERGEVANNDVEGLLGVSDATATNYLEELENEGKIEQVGRTGAAVRYRLKTNGLP